MVSLVKLFKDKMDSWQITGVQLAKATGRSQSNISQIRSGAVSPSVADFAELIEVCDRLKPGFKNDYYASLSGQRLDLNQLVGSLSSAELSVLLVCVSQRIQSHQMQPMVMAS